MKFTQSTRDDMCDVGLCDLTEAFDIVQYDFLYFIEI